MLEQSLDLSQIDFDQAEKIELSGELDARQYSSFQYFSSPSQFKERLNALMGWASKTGANTIYGTITIITGSCNGEAPSPEARADGIAEFEDIFIRSIRVPRKYTPPVDHASKKRKSDDPDYTNIKGNFDIACRTPGGGDAPHILEFVLYDCSYEDALKKKKTFAGFAKDLGLNVQIGLVERAAETARPTKSRFLLG